MIKKRIKYIDYDGNERTEDHYFNLSKAELTEMEVSHKGGLTKVIDRIIEEQDAKKMIEIFKDLVLKSYGKKSLDGRKFIKNDELRDDFSQTEAYVNIFMELATDSKSAAEFVSGIMPSDIATSTEVKEKIPMNVSPFTNS